eukprot:scaffold87262_cov63-Attheya_sp.AAC.4
MSSTFQSSITTFSEPLCWDVSGITSMRDMFNSASAFNKDISSWDVSSITDTDHMFYRASAFNQKISSWDVSKVTNTENMFVYNLAFNQDLCVWAVKTPSLSIVDGMFLSTACPQKGSPTVGITANPRLGPFCHACTP